MGGYQNTFYATSRVGGGGECKSPRVKRNFTVDGRGERLQCIRI